MDDQAFHTSKQAELTRRRFLKWTAGTTVALGGSPFLAKGLFAQTHTVSARRKAKNVIFLVSDGMSWGTFTCAAYYSRLFLNQESTWEQLMGSPSARTILMDTASLDSHVTDSAAAGSAWGCGKRVPNGSLNVTENGQNLEPILVTAKKHGYRTGLVTTTRVTHATPASFAANIPFRWEEDAIAEQLLERQIDVLMGGGSRHFDPSVREDRRDLISEFSKQGFSHFQTKAELAAASNPERLVGLFQPSHLPFHVDWLNQPDLQAEVPNLAEMTQFALGALSDKPEGFVLQVEAARVDHAAHINCAAGLLLDQIAFDEAVQVALDFQKDNPDTLVIVTSDHGNASPGLMGTGPGYRETNPSFEHIRHFRESYERLLPKLMRQPSTAAVVSEVEAATGIALTQQEASAVSRAFVDRGDIPYVPMQAGFAVLSAALANHTSFAWAGMAHTNEWCPVTLLGPGSNVLGSKILNTELHGLVCHTLGMEPPAA